MEQTPKKSALLLSGQLRTFYKTFENILNNVIIPNSFDVFLYIDCPIRQDRISNSQIPSQVFKTPQIVKYRYMTLEENEEYSKELDKILNKPALINSMLVEGRSFDLYLRNSGSILEYFHYSRGMDMIETWEKENGIKYDYIMRGRFDMAFTEPFHIIKFFEFLPTVLIGPSEGIEHHPDDKSCPRDHCGKKTIANAVSMSALRTQSPGDMGHFISNLGKIFKSIIDYGNLKSDPPSSLEYMKELQDNNGFFREEEKEKIMESHPQSGYVEEPCKRANKSIFTVRHNVIWCGRRKEMDKMRKLFKAYGDYHIGASRTWDSETQFHQFLMLNDISHIDYFSEREKDIYNVDKNTKFLSDPEEALFALIR